MAATGTPTPNIGLRIPQGTDPASVDDINYNSNLLDTKLGAVGNTSVQDQIDSLNSNKANFTTALKNTNLPVSNQQMMNVAIFPTTNIMYVGNNSTIDDVIVQTKSGDVSISTITKVTMNDTSKNLNQLLSAKWTTDVPNDGAVRIAQITSNGGAWYGIISRYSTNYGAGMFVRYDGYSAAAFLNNGTVTVKNFAYQN